MWWMMCIISMLWQQLSKLVNKAQSTSFPHGKHANLLLCLQLRCIIWSGDNSAHKDTCACAAHPNYRDWHSLTNVDGLVWNYGNSNHWNCMMTSTDIGPGAKNILRLAAVFCHRVPQLAIKCCRKQLLTQQGADALEDAPSKSGGFFRRRGQKIFWYRSFQQLPLIHLSQCPVNITLPVWAHTSPAWPRRMFLLTIFSPLRCCPGQLLVPERCCCLPSWRLHGNVRWLLGQYATVYKGDQGPTNQSLTIRHICPVQVTALYSYTVGSGYRSSILDFPVVQQGN